MKKKVNKILNKEEIIVLGIDPGTHRMGYGVISVKGKKIGYIDCGVIEVKEKDSSTQLLALHKALSEIIFKHHPDKVGIEKLFFTKNQKTAMSVAEARGVAILSAAEAGLPVLEISPTTAKQYITGYGQADKKAVVKMVKLILRMDEIHVLDDATDALGIAIAVTFLG